MERVNRALGEAARFNALQREYAKAPSVTRTRLYLETIKRALPKADRRVLVDPDLESVLPFLSLGGASPPRTPERAPQKKGAK
jgi:membrane protease subunit HflK